MKISVRMLCLAILFSSWNAFAGREFGSKMLETFSEVPAEDIFQDRKSTRLNSSH